ncbi:MAG: hypothetical protein ACLFRG_01725 [Desulfococcaceae bacterium]
MQSHGKVAKRPSFLQNTNLQNTNQREKLPKKNICPIFQMVSLQPILGAPSRGRKISRKLLQNTMNLEAQGLIA